MGDAHAVVTWEQLFPRGISFAGGSTATHAKLRIGLLGCRARAKVRDGRREQQAVSRSELRPGTFGRDDREVVRGTSTRAGIERDRSAAPSAGHLRTTPGERERFSSRILPASCERGNIYAVSPRFPRGGAGNPR